MDELILNLSMIGKESTGLGVYAINCKNELEKKFSCKTISSVMRGDNIIPSPANISIGSSKYASIKRIFYSIFLYPSRLGFVYTPTHHGFLGYENQVITVHDLICVHYPKQHKTQYLYFKHILPKIIKKCKGIFTVSYTAKEDICKYYRVSNDFVHVIPNALSDEDFLKRMNKQNNDSYIKENYLLVVGAGYPHKNIHELIRNHKYWKRFYKLKIVSQKGDYGRRLKKLVQEEKIEDKVEFLGFVDQERLGNLYQNCVALIYPSLWEGFGIPPLEAIFYKKPVILSDIPVFKEVFEDAGIYVKIQNEETWKEAFLILQNQEKIKLILAKRNRILEKYSWRKNGEKLQDILLCLEPRLKGALKNEC